MSVFTKVGRAPERLPRPFPPRQGTTLPKGTLLVALGAFLLTSALLLPLYVHDRVALMPGEVSHHLRMDAPVRATWTPPPGPIRTTSSWSGPPGSRGVRTARTGRPGR